MIATPFRTRMRQIFCGRRFFRALAFSWLLICAAVVAAPAQSRLEQRILRQRIEIDNERAAETRDDDVPSNSTVHGRIVFEESGRPARRARVMLFEERASPGGGTTAMNVTNARGEFEIKHVRAGKYFVAIFAPGVLTPFSFFPPADGQQAPRDYTEARKYLDEISVDGSADVEVSVKARRGGAISGHVAYEDGAPAISANVSLYRRKGGQFERVATIEQADDRGVYRFKSLAPGEYVVSVSELVVHGDPDMGLARAGALLYGGTGTLFATYYPSASSLAEATPLRVEAGQEREGVNLTIAERELHTVAGVVRTRIGGKPLAKARVYIIATASPPAANTGYDKIDLPDATTDASGRFTLREIPDGDYVVNVEPNPDVDVTEVFAPRAQPTPSPKPSGEGESFDEEVEAYGAAPLSRYAAKRQGLKIAGQDIDNFEIVLNDGALITGTVTVEGAKPAPDYTNISAIKVGAASGEEEGKGGSLWQGQFGIGGLAAGRYYLDVNAMDAEGEYYVKSITYNGADITREPLRVEDGAQLKGVRVVLATGVATLEGRVAASANDHAPAVDAHVVVVSADQSRWRLPGAQHHEFAGLTGKFSIDLPPGDYLVFVLPPGKPPQLSESELRERAAAAKRVSLRAAQSATVELAAPGDK